MSVNTSSGASASVLVDCPSCRMELVYSPLDSQQHPGRPGDPAICQFCFARLVVESGSGDSKLMLRVATAEDIAALPSEVLQALNKIEDVLKSHASAEEQMKGFLGSSPGPLFRPQRDSSTRAVLTELLIQATLMKFRKADEQRARQAEANAKEEAEGLLGTPLYQNELKPLCEQIAKICRDNSIPYVSSIQSSPGAVITSSWMPAPRWDGKHVNESSRQLHLAAEMLDGRVIIEAVGNGVYLLTHRTGLDIR